MNGRVRQRHGSLWPAPRPSPPVARCPLCSDSVQPLIHPSPFLPGSLPSQLNQAAGSGGRQQVAHLSCACIQIPLACVRLLPALSGRPSFGCDSWSPEPARESASQPANQPGQRVSQSASQRVTQPTSQPESQSVGQSVRESVSQLVKESVSQPVS